MESRQKLDCSKVTQWKRKKDREEKAVDTEYSFQKSGYVGEEEKRIVVFNKIGWK
jgi:hypothetical protein